MKCEEIEKIIIDYLDKNLDPDTKSQVEKHVAGCERCLDEMRETRKVLDVIASTPQEQPDKSLHLNFEFMLQNEILRQSADNFTAKENTIKSPIRPVFAVAAGLALLLAGSFIGLLIGTSVSGSSQKEELSMLRNEMDELRKTAMISLLKETSSASRIEAVSFSEEITEPDENIIAALTSTLNSDRNVNVRLTAAYALSKYGNLKQVRDSLVNTLSVQKDPIVQVTLINILVDLKEKNALKQIEQIISNKNTISEVRSVAENGARLLL